MPMSSNTDTTSTPSEGDDQRRSRHNQPGGRGHHGRGGGGGRGRGGDRRGQNSQGRGNQRFRGATSEIAEYTFGIHEGYTGAKRYTDNIKQLKIQTYAHCSTDVGALFGKNPETPTVAKPDPLTENQKKDEMEKELYKLALREYVEQSRKLKQDVKKMYAVILGQCTEAMINKLKAIEDYEKFNDNADSARLLQEIRRITYLSDEKEDPFMSAATTGSSKLYKMVQDRETVTTYHDTWSNMAEVVRQKGGGFVNNRLIKTVLESHGKILSTIVAKKLMEDTFLDKSEHKQYIKAKAKAENKYLASLFIKGLSGQKYSKMKEDELANQCSWGSNKYPADITAAYEMAMNYKNADGNRRDRQRAGQGLEGLLFSQNDGGRGTGNQQAVAGTDGRTWYNTVCYHCNQPGHRSAQCPERARDDGNADEGGANEQEQNSGASHFTRSEMENEEDEISETTTDINTQEVGEYGLTFSQMVKRQKGEVDQDWILLDSQSTHSIFSNGSLLTNIRHCGHTGLTMYSKGGSQHTVMIGDYEPLGITVWYNKDSLANILSM